MNEDEKIRINLSMAFIATYLTLIFTIPKFITIDKTLIVPSLIYGVFVIGGIIISSLFFLYLVLSSLELSYKKEKVIYFLININLTKTQVKIIKYIIYEVGIKMLFFSFTIPILYLIVRFEKWLGLSNNFAFWTGLVLIILSNIYNLFKRSKNSLSIAKLNNQFQKTENVK